MERNQERPLEGGDPGPRIVVARRLGRSRVPADGDPGRRRRRRAARAARRRVSRASPHRFVVFAIDRRTGKIVWERVAREERPHEASHPDNGTWASSSAITDGQHVFAYFESLRPLRLRHERQAALAEGSRRQEDAERVRRGHHAGRCTATASSSSGTHQGQSFIVALDKRDRQRDLARRARGNRHAGPRRSSSNTTAARRSSTNGMNRLRSYDLETGQDRLGERRARR